MTEAKRKYNKKLKTREVTFYLHERQLYNFSKTINFSKLVKEALKNTKEFNAYIDEVYGKVEGAKNGNRHI